MKKKNRNNVTMKKSKREIYFGDENVKINKVKEANFSLQKFRDMKIDGYNMKTTEKQK